MSRIRLSVTAIVADSRPRWPASAPRCRSLGADDDDEAIIDWRG
jgi:hypothetical protein